MMRLAPKKTELSRTASARAGLAVSSLSEGEMKLGFGWWSVQRSFVERRSAARDGGSYNNNKKDS
jgi:hypothetical protein